jgi:hypothetical protein
VVEEVLDCVEEWKRREKAFEAGPQKYIASSVVDSFVYGASGLSVVGEHVSLQDERRPVQAQANPFTQNQ